MKRLAGPQLTVSRRGAIANDCLQATASGCNCTRPSTTAANDSLGAGRLANGWCGTWQVRYASGTPPPAARRRLAVLTGSEGRLIARSTQHVDRSRRAPPRSVTGLGAYIALSSCPREGALAQGSAKWQRFPARIQRPEQPAAVRRCKPPATRASAPASPCGDRPKPAASAALRPAPDKLSRSDSETRDSIAFLCATARSLIPLPHLHSQIATYDGAPLPRRPTHCPPPSPKAPSLSRPGQLIASPAQHLRAPSRICLTRNQGQIMHRSRMRRLMHARGSTQTTAPSHAMQLYKTPNGRLPNSVPFRRRQTSISTHFHAQPTPPRLPTKHDTQCRRAAA